MTPCGEFSPTGGSGKRDGRPLRQVGSRKPFRPGGEAVPEEDSLSHLTRKTTEVKSLRTREWIRDRVKSSRRYRLPRGGKVPKDIQRTRKEAAS